MIEPSVCAMGELVGRRWPDAPWARCVSACVCVGAVVWGGACQSPLAIDPFTDELAHAPSVTTPSVEGARASTSVAIVRQRPYRRSTVTWSDGVVHGPLYLQDPTETPDVGDDVFAWTREDFASLLVVSGRWLVNTVFLPVRAIATPPWVGVTDYASRSPPDNADAPG
ncbi:MAG: hypothetical protein ACE5E6_11725 [Phycisphaerae bacterium]